MLPEQAKPGIASVETEQPSGELAECPIIKVTRNGIAVQELRLDQPNFLIGRADTNDISIPSSYVSWHHMLLVRSGGLTILIDLNSTNGTFVNSRRVFKYAMEHEDVITLDQHSMFVTYRLEYCDPAMTADGAVVDAKTVGPVIQKALANFENLLVESDTDLLPELSEHVPTVVGFIDDR